LAQGLRIKRKAKEKPKESLMLRITLVSHSDETTTLHLAGRVADDAVDLLAAEGDRHLQETQLLVLNLDEVKFIDEAGLALRQGCGSSSVLRGAYAYLRTWPLLVLDAT